MIIDKSLIEDTLEGKEFIFLPDFYKSETYSAGRIKLMKQFPPQRIVGIESALENFEKQQGIKYAELQRKAILEAISGGLLILTGGPGTGKTTTLNAIISLLRIMELRFNVPLLLEEPHTECQNSRAVRPKPYTDY